MYVISAVIGLAMIIALTVYVWVFADGIPVVFIPACLIGVIIFPIEVMGFLLNWKKCLIGMIAPIPVISMIIEHVKGMIYAIKALIALIKKEEVFVIHKNAESNE